MSDTPTSDQITDLRGDIGDTGTPPAFTDPEIQRFWYRVRGADNEVIQHEATLALMARALIGNSAKLRDYSTGNTSEKSSQIFDHLKDIYAMYKKSLERVQGTNKDVAMGIVDGIARVEVPTDEFGGGTLGYWIDDPLRPDGSEFE